jgi:hypothetical protein
MDIHDGDDPKVRQKNQNGDGAKDPRQELEMLIAVGDAKAEFGKPLGRSIMEV